MHIGRTTATVCKGKNNKNSDPDLFHVVHTHVRKWPREVKDPVLLEIELFPFFLSLFFFSYFRA
jgi:hypothetical protein